jgi:hypothetical protein
MGSLNGVDLNYRIFLIALANKLDEEGKYELADNIDKDFEEFLKLLEEGKLNFDFEFFGIRNPNKPYSNRGFEQSTYSITPSGEN